MNKNIPTYQVEEIVLNFDKFTIITIDEKGVSIPLSGHNHRQEKIERLVKQVCKIKEG
ncbi:hypothetical protein [Aeromonas phage AerS_266]|nr:hypothetical protein [Aeromonas phage AerS_266]